VTNELEREIYSITLNEEMQFKKQSSLRLRKFDASWETFSIQALRKTIEQRVIQSRNTKMHLVSHISESIRRMGSGNNFITDISEWLQMANVKEAYQPSNKVNYIQQMLMHNDYIGETLTHLALQGWYKIDLAKVFNKLSTTEPR
jgi:hypothetical protein